LSSWGGISSSEMAAIDENAEWLGVPRILLMENAGAWVARVVYQWLGGVAGVRITVVCGTGNNGGDGFAAARHLAGLGADVTVILVGDPDRIKTLESRTNFEAVKAMRESIKLFIARSIEDLERIRHMIEESEVVVDAIFGTGVRGRIAEPWRSAIQLINSSRALKVAVDIPSGLNPDTGEAEDVCVHADVTVTFHRPKLGLPAAADHCGELIIAPIGRPPEAEIVMGPGNLRQALRMMGDHVEEIVLLEPLPDEARSLMSMLGAEPKTREACVVYAGRRIDLLKDLGGYSWAVVLGVAPSPRIISIIGEDEASRLGINMNMELRRKYEAYSRKASELENRVYIMGRSSDLLLGDSKWRLGWVGRPFNDLGLNTLIATTLALLARGVNEFDAASAAGYLAGIATSSGYDAAISELKRIMED
jgi:hydroxyethylthiazole kinase-like uncharacterized protein yjeF